MEVVVLLLYVGAVWVTGAVALFIWNVRSRGHEHADRLAILPLEDNWSEPVKVPVQPPLVADRKSNRP